MDVHWQMHSWRNKSFQCFALLSKITLLYICGTSFLLQRCIKTLRIKFPPLMSWKWRGKWNKNLVERNFSSHLMGVTKRKTEWNATWPRTCLKADSCTFIVLTDCKGKLCSWLTVFLHRFILYDSVSLLVFFNTIKHLLICKCSLFSDFKSELRVLGVLQADPQGWMYWCTFRAPIMELYIYNQIL